mmetsp:Transcript_9586/g.21991  ORF Transcript_9586/g.21991 Transcript_9586/m.21991 type:complete len:451 (-) Transcript_9586:66-1418(-)
MGNCMGSSAEHARSCMGGGSPRPIRADLASASDTETAMLNPSPQKRDANVSSSSTSCACRCCCSCLCILVVILIGAYAHIIRMLTNIALDNMLHMNREQTHQYCNSGLAMENLTYKIWWPGCGEVSSSPDFQKCTSPCFDPKLLKRMNAFNKKNPGTRVSYPSRVHDKLETIQLEGWWLPAANGSKKTTPRIVVQHGFKANSNKFRTALAAYMLRTIGYDVLVNNFRDHCYSDDSDVDIYQWGQAYPYDLLGAWDYLTSDPDGLLGGSRPANKVGLMGFSKGAFTAINAFGLEGDVPAVWVDSPPFTPEVVFANGAQIEMDKMGIGFLGPLLIGPVWWIVTKNALSHGVDLNSNLPSKVLPQGPDKTRPIFWVGNEEDTTVPLYEGRSLMEFVEKYPEKYSIRGRWEATGACNGDDHCVTHLHHFDKYLHELDKFWSAALDVTEAEDVNV